MDSLMLMSYLRKVIYEIHFYHLEGSNKTIYMGLFKAKLTILQEQMYQDYCSYWEKEEEN